MLLTLNTRARTDHAPEQQTEHEWIKNHDANNLKIVICTYNKYFYGGKKTCIVKYVCLNIYLIWIFKVHVAQTLHTNPPPYTYHPYSKMIISVISLIIRVIIIIFFFLIHEGFVKGLTGSCTLL